jgi:hypothetical protein
MTFGTAIILIIVAALAGYVFGIVDSRFTQALRKKNEKPAIVEKPVMVEHNRPGEHTVLEVTTDKSLKWHLELDGTRLDDPAAISPEQRQRVINVIVQIRPWMEGKPVPAAPAMAVPAPATESPALKPPINSTVAPAPLDNPTLKPSVIRGFSSMIVGDVKSQIEKKPTSIVMMIDEVLQAKLSGTPLKAKGIKLEDGLSGGVLVCVGSQRYTSIDAVPEPEIRDIIKASIADWEKSQ